MPFERYLQPAHQSAHVNSRSASPGTRSNDSSESAIMPAYDDSLDGQGSSAGYSNSNNQLFIQIPQFLSQPVAGVSNLKPFDADWLQSPADALKLGEESIFLSNKPFLVQDDASILTPEPSAKANSRNNPFDYGSPLLDRSYSSPTNASIIALQQALHPSPPPQTTVSNEEFAALTNPLSFNAPSSLGLPVYSTSGFDLLPIFARIATRPFPKIPLGPVDMTCSFAVVAPKMHDSPIVYVSPSFCRLTGYSETECIGRNCRFLQAPSGKVEAGQTREYTDNEAVAHLKRCVLADKECQASIVNYKKDGTAFINLVTIIPVTAGGDGESADEVVYHVGFQIDLTEQPNAILRRLKDGTYKSDASIDVVAPTAVPSMSRDKKAQSISSIHMSKHLRNLLFKPAFLDSLPISQSSLQAAPNRTMAHPSPSMDKSADEANPSNHLLSLLLLDYSPDFVHVVSLKGSLLYIAPSVRRVLGYQPEELLGKALSDICHPADTVPLMRELKESSTITHQPTSASSAHPNVINPPTAAASGPIARTSQLPRPVDLLFRARNKAGVYVWMECRGRLYVEPGKGRKAIILSGRVKPTWEFTWSAMSSMGVTQAAEGEFWGLVSAEGTFLSAGAGVSAVLGYTTGNELVGRRLGEVVASDTREVDSNLRAVSVDGQAIRCVYTQMRRIDRSLADVRLVLYRPKEFASNSSSSTLIVYQVTLVETLKRQHARGHSPSQALIHSISQDMFSELQPERSSSWQYELQQLRYENERLKEEISKLEQHSGGPVTSPTNSASSLTSKQPQTKISQQQQTMRYATPTQQMLPPEPRPMSALPSRGYNSNATPSGGNNNSNAMDMSLDMAMHHYAQQYSQQQQQQYQQPRWNDGGNGNAGPSSASGASPVFYKTTIRQPYQQHPQSSHMHPPSSSSMHPS